MQCTVSLLNRVSALDFRSREARVGNDKAVCSALKLIEAPLRFSRPAAGATGDSLTYA
jgi:hypothetical protein